MFDDFLSVFDDDIWEERPVDLKTFLYDKRFMNLPPLSPIQEEIIERGSQIYKKETLIELYGNVEGMKIWDQKTTRDLVLILGKGSGKNTCSQILCLYAVYKILCLKDPASYYQITAGDNISIVNMAINAKQAKRAFFDGLVEKLRRTAWFNGKYKNRMDDIEFDKDVKVFSMHSSFEAAEGLNIIIAVLDEIDGFDILAQSEAIFKALSGTVSSRHPEIGKVISLSFPRRKEGFMMNLYNDAVATKEITSYKHTFKLNDDLPDGEYGNEFTVEWDEDEITGYKYNNVFCIKAPTFRVHPLRKIEHYKMDFYRDMDDTLMRVCANPPESGNAAFFKNHDKLRIAIGTDEMDHPNGWNHETEELDIVPETDCVYYIHVDLSKVHDRTVVAMGHVVEWMEPENRLLADDKPAPVIKVDLFRVWEATRLNSVDHNQVLSFIMTLARLFNVEVVTFDQWGSIAMIETLLDAGVEAKRNPLAKPEYHDFRAAVGELRLWTPYDERFWKEVTNLVVLPDGKVDHPNKNYNDISESVTGVVRNCIEFGEPYIGFNVETRETVKRDLEKERALSAQKQVDKTIKLDSDLLDWLDNAGTV